MAFVNAGHMISRHNLFQDCDFINMETGILDSEGDIHISTPLMITREEFRKMIEHLSGTEVFREEILDRLDKIQNSGRNKWLEDINQAISLASNLAKLLFILQSNGF